MKGMKLKSGFTADITTKVEANKNTIELFANGTQILAFCL
jgi:hypothetical protein